MRCWLPTGLTVHLSNGISRFWSPIFLALLPLALQGDEEHQRAIVCEMKAMLYRYWEPIIDPQRASEVRSHEAHV